MEDRDLKKREMLAEDEVLYMVALACSKGLDMYAPVKLQMVMSRDFPPRPPR